MRRRPWGRPIWLSVWIPTVCVAVVLPLLLLNLCEVLSLLVLPFSKATFRRVNAVLGWSVWRFWSWGLHYVVGVGITLEGDALRPYETAIAIGNHQGMTDIMAELTIAGERTRIKDVKWMVKNALRYIPLFGWAMHFLDFIFLRRNWADDQAMINQTFRRYRERREPFWLMIFPEGTRVRPKKLEASRAFAAKIGVAPMDYVLMPRPKGFCAALSGLKGKVTAIYSFTLFYGTKAPTLLQLVLGDVARIHVLIKRHAVDDLPSGDDHLATWLLEEFRAKDKWLQQMRAQWDCAALPPS